MNLIFKTLFFIFIMCFEVSAEAAYSHVNSKGNKYFLYEKEVALKNSDKVRKIFFFAKSPDNKNGKPLAKVPSDRVVSETKNGLLVLKKNKKSLQGD